MKNIQEAKTHLSRLVEQAAAGEEIIISKSGKPMARLVAYIPLNRQEAAVFWLGESGKATTAGKVTMISSRR